MKAKGVLFKAEMVRALLNTAPDVWPAVAIDPEKPFKWQTRRLVDLPTCFRSDGVISKGAHGFFAENWPKQEREFSNYGRIDTVECPYPEGTIIYAKETYAAHEDFNKVKPSLIPKDSLIVFKVHELMEIESATKLGKWRTGRFMPKHFARLWFKVMRVRVQRVHDIGKDGRKAVDVLAEGISQQAIDHWKQWLHPDDAPAHTYGVLWESINGKGSWDKNPWVFAYDLARISPP